MGSPFGIYVINEVAIVPSLGTAVFEGDPKVLEWALEIGRVSIAGLNPRVLFPPLDKNKGESSGAGKELEVVLSSLSEGSEIGTSLTSCSEDKMPTYQNWFSTRGKSLGTASH